MSGAVRSLARAGDLAVVSVFNSADKTTEIRNSYLRACGIDDLVEEEGRFGKRFSSVAHGLSSESFTPESLLRAIESGGDVTVLRVAEHGAPAAKHGSMGFVVAVEVRR